MFHLQCIQCYHPVANPVSSMFAVFISLARRDGQQTIFFFLVLSIYLEFLFCRHIGAVDGVIIL